MNCVDIQLQEAQDKEMLVVVDAGEVDITNDGFDMLSCKASGAEGELSAFPIPPSGREGA